LFVQFFLDFIPNERDLPWFVRFSRNTHLLDRSGIFPDIRENTEKITGMWEEILLHCLTSHASGKDEHFSYEDLLIVGSSPNLFVIVIYRCVSNRISSARLSTESPLTCSPIRRFFCSPDEENTPDRSYFFILRDKIKI
jgi:hypothetical protein